MKKATLIDLDLNVLVEYSKLNDLNTDWNIGDYLNLNYDLNAAVAFSKLFFPDFIESQGCILLGLTYNETSFLHWFNKAEGNIPAVEAKSNAYELADYFSTNRIDLPKDKSNQLILAFGQILKKAWEVNCNILFPHRDVVTEIYEDYGTYRITLYSKF